MAPHGEPEARLLRWGVIPPWAKDLKGGAKLINARVDGGTALAVPHIDPEGVAAGAAGRQWLFRGLAPEYQRRGEPRQPFYFQVDGGETFAFAALWTPAKVAGEWINSITLLTCEASNPVAAAIHDRMPVILADEEARRAWLDPRLDAQDALSLCQPLPAGRLTARPANPALNRPDPDTRDQSCSWRHSRGARRADAPLDWIPAPACPPPR